MRITGGTFGGIPLKTPRSLNTRPSSDRLRQSLFNVLDHRFQHEYGHVADLFAGSGSLAIEAYSRGARFLSFFEKDAEAQKCIEQNISKLKNLGGNFELFSKPKIENWPSELKANTQISTLFCDPPYGKGLGELALKTFGQHANRILDKTCLAILEEDSKYKFDPKNLGGHWHLELEKEIGNSRLYFLKLAGC